MEEECQEGSRKWTEIVETDHNIGEGRGSIQELAEYPGIVRYKEEDLGK